MKKAPQKRAKRTGTSRTQADRLESSIGLDKRTEFVQTHLERLQGIFKTLLSDENFLTLLRAESIKTIPNYLKRTMEPAGNEVPRNPVTQDGSNRHRKGEQRQEASLVPTKTLALDQLTLTICFRYAMSLMANAKIKAYLAKHYSSQLAAVEKTIESCEECVQQEGIHSVLLKKPTRK